MDNSQGSVSGDGAPGPNHFSSDFEKTKDLIEQVLSAAGYLAWRAQHHEERAGVYWDDPGIAPEAIKGETERGTPYAALLDDALRLYALKHRLVLSIEHTSLDFSITTRAVDGVSVMNVATSDLCDRCGQVHQVDWGCFIRNDSLAFHMETWVSSKEAWNNF